MWLSCLSYIIFLTNIYHYKHITTYNNEDPKFVEQLLRPLHVDDLNGGGENIQDCYNFYNKAKARLDQGSFNLRKFQSNSSELEYMINSKINHNPIVTKVLGLIWDKHKDNITFTFQNLVALIFPCPAFKFYCIYIRSSWLLSHTILSV